MKIHETLIQKKNGIIRCSIYTTAGGVAQKAGKHLEGLSTKLANDPEAFSKQALSSMKNTARRIGQKIEREGIKAAVSLTTDKDDLREQKFKSEEYHHNVQSLKACLRTVNIIDCTIANSEGDKAIKLTEDLVDKKDFAAESQIDGVADAFRHCYWSASLTRRLGGDKAQKITKLHEKLSKEGPNSPDSKMDLHNNNVGVSIGKRAKTDQEVQFLYLEAIKKGKLAVLDRS